MEELTKKEQKAIATIIAKEVVRQMKANNNESSLHLILNLIRLLTEQKK